MSCYRKIIHSYKETVSLTSTKAWDLICSMECLFDNLEETDKEKFWEVMKDIHEDIKGKHFDEVYAEYEVSDMYSTNIRGVVVRGDEAKVHEKIILSAITFWFKDEDAKEGKVWDYFNN